MSKGYKQNYRKIWMDHFGEIPIDSDGRSYDIHHIDGNKNNNQIQNLIAVSIKEHFDIHFKQGDFEACKAISLRLQNFNFKGYSQSEETRKKIKDHHLSKKENHWSKRQEVKLKISESIKGEKNNNYGKYGSLHHNFGKKWKLTEDQAERRRGSNNSYSRKIYQYSENLELVKEWKTLKEAATHYKIHSSAIVNSIKRNNKSKGFIWSYIPLDK
jgi:hypothetical protein